MKCIYVRTSQGKKLFVVQMVIVFVLVAQEAAQVYVRL